MVLGGLMAHRAVIAIACMMRDSPENCTSNDWGRHMESAAMAWGLQGASVAPDCEETGESLAVPPGRQSSWVLGALPALNADEGGSQPPTQLANLIREMPRDKSVMSAPRPCGSVDGDLVRPQIR
ncbi:hypothetical protein E5288_WYG022369 [Bos mutus]|uniref:Uncharacterized protein n=1 Tax=Bos mutus TaxID=72004 RepID=A0A6B0RU69_9CETA|nr:hypothetical protein [Bos mutus]